MNHCETCAYFKPDLEDWRVRLSNGIHGGLCKSPFMKEEYDHTENSLVYSYSEGGSFWVGPKFGCVNHEPKETK
jgi:hypothetical protein